MTNDWLQLWTANDWLQLWTALAVTASAITGGLWYRLGLRQSALDRPIVSVFPQSSQGANQRMVRVAVEGIHSEKWLIVLTKIAEPPSGQFVETTLSNSPGGNPVYTATEGGERSRKKSFLASGIQGADLMIECPPGLLSIKFKLAFRANPRITCWCTTQSTISH